MDTYTFTEQSLTELKLQEMMQEQEEQETTADDIYLAWVVNEADDYHNQVKTLIN